VSVLKKDVEILSFYQTLIIICAINFEIVNSNKAVTNHLSNIFVKFQKKLSNNWKKYLVNLLIVVLCLKN